MGLQRRIARFAMGAHHGGTLCGPWGSHGGTRQSACVCKVHVRIGRDTAFTGCTVWPMKGKMMTKRETEDRMFVVFGGVFCALLIGCWAALVIALI